MSSLQFPAPSASVPLAVRVRARIFAHRNLLAGAPLIPALALAAPPGRGRLVPALVVAGLGVVLRAWCVAFNRYAQGERKTLATGGPYACLRNPLYVGNALVLLAAALVAGPLWLVPATGAWAFLVYEQVVRHEESRLAEKYGAAYASYCQSVPRWIPRRLAAPQALPRGLARALLVQSRSLLLLVPFATKLWWLAA